MNIYVPTVVQALQTFYGDLLYDIAKFPNIPTHLTALAQHLWKGVQEQHPAIYPEINNYHKMYLGKSADFLKNASLTFADCQQTIANEYGFDNWEAVEQLGDLAYDLPFEKAVNLLLKGELAALQQQLVAHPYLLSATSRYGHQATLLHYVGSNGVEFWRQQVPLNLYEITVCLLEAGADKAATMQVYGGEFDTYALLLSSAHPTAAGVLNNRLHGLLADSADF